jgi:transposase
MPNVYVMFIKKVTNSKKGISYLTYRLVKSRRVNGKPQHVNILELGSLADVPSEKFKALADRIEQLIQDDALLFDNNDPFVEDWAHYYYQKLISRRFGSISKKTHSVELPDNAVITEDHLASSQQIDNVQEVLLDTFESITSHEIGSEWLCAQAIRELGLDTYLMQRPDWNSNETAVGLLALLGRLIYPDSDKKTAEWLNENSAAFEFYSPESGNVDRNRLTQCTNKLYNGKEEIEKYLSTKIESIYNIENKLILYDLTNTHFEGQMKLCPKAKHGHNKQKRYDCRQITLGLLADQDGFVKSSKYYEGNIGEPSTFADVVSALDPYINTGKRPVVVMDAGIASEDNLKKCLGKGADYICVSRSGHKDLIQKVDKENLVCFENKSGEQVKGQFFYQDLEYEIDGVKFTHKETLLYVETPSKQAKERGMFERKQKGFEDGLKTINQSLLTPQKNKKNQSVEKIHERIGRLKEKYSGIARAYSIEVLHSQGQATQVKWQFIEANLIEPAIGSYFIRTSITADDEELLWKTYRVAGEIESIFRTLKSDLNCRPIFHQKELNIEAHLNLAVLAYFVVSHIRFRLKQCKINHSWTEIIRIMNSQKCNLNSIINKKGEKILLKTCTRPQMKANEIYQAMKYKPMPFFRKISLLDFG